jgi:peptidoglycan/LPS O-acetylase OafA/YrhL
MALSHHEQRALERIAVELYTEDPRLVAALAYNGWAFAKWRQRIAAFVMFMAGMAMLACAILIPRSIPGGVFVVSVLGYMVMFCAALRWCNAPRLPRRRAVARGGDASPAR